MNKLWSWVLIPVIILFVMTSCGNDSQDKKTVSKHIDHQYLYEICIDTLKAESDVVKKNEFLANIMLRNGVSYNTIDYIARQHKKVFDVSKIRVGNPYTFLTTQDSIAKPLYWIYEIDRTNYAVFGLTDSMPAWIGHKEVITKIETVKGTITSSLWNSMVEAGSDPNLVLKLSDIFAWTIDFFGIQNGDSYKVIYERYYIEGEPVEVGKILAAYFNNEKTEHYAFLFKQGDKEDYFDENGDNLRKAFLKAPLNYRRISSTFSNARRHPVTKIVRPHHGVDYAAPKGTPVQTIGDGTVIEKGFQKGGGGNYLKIKHNSTYTTVYMHLNGFAKGIKQGSKVKQGDLIGYVGSTGLSTGPHLDFRLMKNGTYINPLTFKSPSADPVERKNKIDFGKDVEAWRKFLDRE